MNAREALNSAVDALEQMGFVILPRSEWAAKDKEIAALREALVQIDALDPEGHTAGFSVYALRGLVERMGAIARAALAQGSDDERS